MFKNNIHKLFLAVGALALALLMTACSLSGGKKPAPESRPQPQEESLPDPEETMVFCGFYEGDEELGSDSFPVGSLINDVPYEKAEDEQYVYTFLGWDADGDGVAEEFPYTLTCDTHFQALIQKKAKIYHYDIYVDGKLKVSKDGHYGDKIQYPDVKSEIKGNEVKLFLGWTFNGALLEGNRYYTTLNGNYRIDAYFAQTQIFKLIYEKQIAFASYLQPGETLQFPSDFETIAPAGMEIRWYLDASFKQAFIGKTMPAGNLTLYGRFEDSSIPSGTRITSREQLLDYFNRMIINMDSSAEFYMDYSYGDLNSLLSYLTKNAIEIHGYEVNAQASGKVLSFVMSFSPIAQRSTGKALYTQIQPFGLKASKGRDAAYNGFASDNRAGVFEVHNSDALYYALEHGYQPLIPAQYGDLIRLYENMKQVLRTIVEEGMSDVQKVRAIYEYLIMNVTYDDALLQLVKADAADIQGYNGFYLEGVFNDHLAVCDGISKAFSALCNMEGIQAVRVTGTITGEGTQHAWNKVKLDGKWYIVDATAGGIITGSEEVLTYSFFLIKESTYRQHATDDGKAYSSYVCNTDYNFYGKTKAEGISLKASSIDDAANLFSAVYNAASGKTSLDMQLAFSYSSLEDAVTKILEKINMNVQVNYLSSLDSLIIVFTK